MGLCMLCARRGAVLAALAGGTMIAVLATGWCADGIVWSGTAGIEAMRAALHAIGL